MRVLCVARHPYLSEHLGRFFDKLGVDTVPCVGLHTVIDDVPLEQLDAVICDFDLLAPLPPDAWDTHPLLSTIPVIAVSLTRHPGEAHLRDTAGVAGFLYLPTLEPDAAREMLASVRRSRGVRSSDALTWQASTPTAPLR